MRILLQTGKTRDPRLPETPLYGDLMDEFKTPELGRRVATVMLGSGELGRPDRYPSSDGAGTDQGSARCFHEKHGRSAAAAEAAKKNLEITAVSGEELAKIAREVINQPPDVLDRIRKIFWRSNGKAIGI